MTDAVYKDAAESIESRVEDLLKRLSLEEKIGQIDQPFYGWRAFTRSGETVSLTDEFCDAYRTLQFGAMYGLFRADPWSGMRPDNGLLPQHSAQASNLVQRFVIENNRHGIPLLLSEETPHGHMAIGSTVLPVSLMLAGTWNRALSQRVGELYGAEMRARGATVGYGPVVDVAQEPRWGRVEEGFGEDPFLAGELAAEVTRGMQGERLDAPNTVAATLKHFAAYGAPEGGHNSGPAHVGPRELRQFHLPPFQRCVEAGAASIMAAYNDIDGIPCHANRELLTTILRDEWKFDGVVVADGTGVDCLQRISKAFEGRAAAAINAGVDVCLWGESFQHMHKAVEKGMVSIETIDDAVRRVLRLKFRLGLFEHPYVAEDAYEVIASPAHLETARQVAREGITLLENNGILPLKKETKTIAVIGPNADTHANQLGNYTAPPIPGRVVSVLEGIREAASAEINVVYAKGCSIKSPNDSGIAEAVEAARKADVAVVVVGGSSTPDYNTYVNDAGQAVVDPNNDELDMECGEGFDRATLTLAGHQQRLLDEVKATGTPMVVVLIMGRPYTIPWLAENADALVLAWYPGEQGGNAVADVLFGDYNPSGRLPISFPRHEGQLPVYYYHQESRQLNRKDYVLSSGTPLYSFGYGKSYTTFTLENLEATPTTATLTDKITVSLNVTNMGKMAGAEVIQLYVRDEEASILRPNRELKAFERVEMSPGETKNVRFTLESSAFSFIGRGLTPIVEPGDFILMVCGGEQEFIETKITLTQ